MPTDQEYASGPSWVNDVNQAKEIVNKGEFTGPIDSVNGFKINGTSMNATVTAKAGDSGTVKSGTYTVVAGDATANLKDIVTGLASVLGFSLLVLRSNVNVLGDAAVTVTDGTIRIADGSTFVLTTNDVIKWVAVGAL